MECCLGGWSRSVCCLYGVVGILTFQPKSVCTRELLRLRGLAKKGHTTFLDSYGATNEAEFFAVATEEFLDRPLALRVHATDLYHVLKTFYRQDPAERVNRINPLERNTSNK